MPNLKVDSDRYHINPLVADNVFHTSCFFRLIFELFRIIESSNSHVLVQLGNLPLGPPRKTTERNT